MKLARRSSEPFQDNHKASQLGEAMKEERVELVAGHESSEGLEPIDGALYGLAFTDEFKQEAVQMLLNVHSAQSVAERLGLAGGSFCYLTLLMDRYPRYFVGWGAF